jgi:membrane protease YdiL (CAAX protease family)
VKPAIGAGQAAWLAVRLRFSRVLNQIAARRRDRGGVGRTGTAGKARPGWTWGALLGVLFVLSACSFSSNVLDGLGKRFTAGSPAFVSYVTFEITVVTLACLLITLANKELSAPEWDLEWLMTMPVPLRSLLSIRLLERTVGNTSGLVMLCPFLGVLAFRHGHGYASPLLGVGLGFLMLAPVAAVQTAVDTALKLRLRPSALRNLQALFTVSSTLFLYMSMAAGLPGGFLFERAAALPAFAAWTPPGLAARVLTAHGEAPLRPLLLLALESAAALWLGRWWVARQLGAGVVAAGARESAGRGPRAREAPRRPSTPVPTPMAARGQPALSVVQRRELRLLGRDRNFLVQTLLMPIMVVGAQAFFSVRKGGGGFAGLLEGSPTSLAAVAFAVAAYALMFSAFQTLNAEGGALWVLYTLPRPVASVLRDKAVMWAALATLYPLAIFTAAAIWAGPLSLTHLGLFFIVLVGVPVYSVIATALGVFGCNPLAQEVQRKLNIGYVYLYLTLASLYTYAIYATTFWSRAGLMILTILLALALWQKARDQLPYLLDPTASPPAAVSLSDGLIATLFFFVLQGMVMLLLSGRHRAPTGAHVTVAFALAGAVAFTGARVVFWRKGAQGVPRVFGPGAGRAIGWGLGGGLTAAGAGAAYLAAIHRAGGLPSFFEAEKLHPLGLGLWVIPLAVLAAPVFEEFIFRGLVFGGLRRSVRPGLAALASAAIFAIVHPPSAVPPVFVLALCAATVYQRSGLLLAPILTHALYNAAVLLLQLRAGWP